MKKCLVLIVLSALILFLQGCVDLNSGKRPTDFGNARWTAQGIEMYFDVTDVVEEGEIVARSSVGKLTWANETKNVEVLFDYGTGMVVAEAPYSYENSLFLGNCEFGKDDFVVNIHTTKSDWLKDFPEKIKFLRTTPTKLSAKEEDSFVQELIKKHDNSKPANELIEKVYSEQMLLKYRNSKISIVNELMPMECLRKLDGYFYVIYKSEENGYLVILYSDNKGDSYALDFWYAKDNLYSDDFNKLLINQSTVDDVKKIDPYGDFSSFLLDCVTDVFSRHCTVDGYEIRVNYKTTGEDLVVSEVIKLGEEDNIFYNKLLPIDRKLLSKARIH